MVLPLTTCFFQVPLDRMFKIDYYDQNLSMHSPDPADPAITQRVITIMLAEDY